MGPAHMPRQAASPPDQHLHDEPLVSVIMAAWNSEKYIAEAIESVQAQTYTNWELIVVDDASTDRTPEIVQEYAERDPRIRLLRNTENQGPAPSRNRAIRESRGEFIAVLDSNDIALPNRLEVTVPVMQQNPDVAVVGGLAVYILEDGQELGLQKLGTCPQCDLTPERHLAHGGAFAGFHHTAALIRREALRAVGGYDEWFPTSSDYNLWLCLSEQYRLLRVDRPVVRVRLCPGGISFAKQRLQITYGAVAYQRWLWKQRGHRVDVEATFRRALARFGGSGERATWELLYVTGLRCAQCAQFRLARSYFLRSFLANPRRPRALLRAALTLLPDGGEFLLDPLRRRGLIGHGASPWGEGNEWHVDPVFVE